MISLFIDSSLVIVSISVIKDNKILSLIQKDIPNMHSIYATSFVKKALDEAHINAFDIDNIYVVNGPGSFTGLRIGVTIAKTYGYLINKYITPVSSLKAMALSTNHSGLVMSIIPANKTNYYVAIFDEKYNIVKDEEFVSKTKLISLLNEYNPYIIGESDSTIEDYKINKVNLDILKIINYYQDKEKINYHKLLPNYLKQPQAIEDKH